jgi:adenosine deaminase
LKTFVRNSVHYGFLPGASVWKSERYEALVPACVQLESPACTRYLTANPRAAAEGTLERALRAFEHRMAVNGRTVPTPSTNH